MKKKLDLNLIYLTFTNRNAHLIVANKNKKVIWKQSLGSYGVPGKARRAYNYNFNFGYYCGLFLKRKFKSFFKLIIRGWNVREKAFQKGLFKSKIKIIYLLNKTPITFNGCKKINKKRK